MSSVPEVSGDTDNTLELGIQRLWDYLIAASYTLPPDAQEILLQNFIEITMLIIGSYMREYSTGIMPEFPDNLPDIINQTFQRPIKDGAFDLRQSQKH